MLLKINMREYLEAIKTGNKKKENFKKKYQVDIELVQEKVRKEQYIII
ncbi:MAG: hypothetical protein AMQ22_00041 [Candidatus Methanofastidiosum methylothiophilum]|uniref:Uncharacterized protein n=1 Tax=Candidatus Methanofastidiosum methylothiophilum TaxID=1705564 RepID=A0A150J9B6_9EURY|nr:MAG: hypothetical protein AMQ22_00041 [Candidatus Methanofastidiosum methylthiophilus]